MVLEMQHWLFIRMMAVMLTCDSYFLASLCLRCTADCIGFQNVNQKAVT